MKLNGLRLWVEKGRLRFEALSKIGLLIYFKEGLMAKKLLKIGFLTIFSLFSFTGEAWASASTAGNAAGTFGNIFMLVGFLLIFYFMLIRPQTKRAKEHQNLLSNIAKEDEVIITGGILGKVIKVTEQFAVVAIAEGVEVKVQKQAISASLPKGTMKNI